MKEQKNNQKSSIQEYPFDFDRYIAEQLREIEDLDERRFAKTVLVEGLGAMIRQTEQKYKALEERIYQEMEIPGSHYGIVSTIVKREHYDPMNATLFPVMEVDLTPEKYGEFSDTQDYLYVETVYLEADNRRCEEFELHGSFEGKIRIGEEVQKTQCYIRRAARYRDAMEQLYQIFLDNHIPWKTVNTAYLDKFYDICIPKPEGAEWGGKVELAEAIDICFEGYEDVVRQGVIPLWNIEPVTFNSMNFMVPCVDGIYYEHEFLIGEENRKDGYLIQSREEIMEIRHEKERIMIRSTCESFQKWIAYRIVQGEMVRSLDYDAPFMTNYRKDTFIRRYANKTGMYLLTKTDLFRRIMEMDIGDYIEVEDYEIREHGADCPMQESMNWFVRDELFPMESRKVLLLKFRAKNRDDYLNDSMVRFVVSQIQMDISEYRCVGRLV